MIVEIIWQDMNSLMEFGKLEKRNVTIMIDEGKRT